MPDNNDNNSKDTIKSAVTCDFTKWLIEMMGDDNKNSEEDKKNENNDNSSNNDVKDAVSCDLTTWLMDMQEGIGNAIKDGAKSFCDIIGKTLASKLSPDKKEEQNDLTVSNSPPRN